MGWDIDVKEKIYLRLANEIFFRIYNGTYQLGSKLPSYYKHCEGGREQHRNGQKGVQGIATVWRD